MEVKLEQSVNVTGRQHQGLAAVPAHGIAPPSWEFFVPVFSLGWLLLAL